MVKNWREIKAGQEILKFVAEAENQVIACKFLSEGTVKEFTTPKYNKAMIQIGTSLNESVEFSVEYKGKQLIFSTGSSRLITALQEVSPDITNKRIKMTKTGTGMDTEYSAELIK